ncbi:MAG: hypothetical protein ABII90_05140, partial [Bacteroidota bacterium]
MNNRFLEILWNFRGKVNTILLICTSSLLIASLTSTAQIPTGTYTIGGSSPDYADFSAAVTDLNTNGLVGNGPVTFDVRTGTYTEQIVINQITNASAVNTITFQSESGDSTDVTLSYSLAVFLDNYTVKLNGADYITFKSMTISATNSSNNRVVELTNGATFNSFLNNILTTISGSNGDEVVYSDDATSTDNDNLFQYNWFLNGEIGLQFEGASGNLKRRLTIKDNLFETYRWGLYLTYLEDIEITGNRIINASVANGPLTQGMYLFHCDSSLIVKKNDIVLTAGTNNQGMQIQACISTYGGTNGEISNNMIIVGGSGTSTYGIYTNATTNKNFYHNSILNLGTNASAAKSLHVNGPYSANPANNANFTVMNNIFMASNGRAIYNSVGGIISCNYNEYYVTSGGDIGYWDGTAVANLAALQAENSDDANSISSDPLFASTTAPYDLHITTVSPVIGNGTVLADVIDDIDGELRDPNPDIGADEFGCVAIPIYIGTDAVFCFGDSLVLDAGAGYSSYLWSDSSTGQTLTVDSSGTYSVTVTDTGSCSGNDAINITVNPIPAANITPQGATTFCDGDSLKLQSDAATTYLWLVNGSSTGLSSQNIFVSTAGDYQVIVADAIGCSDTSAIETVILSPLPIIDTTLMIIDSSNCGSNDGAITGITVSGGLSPYTYEWIDGLLAVVGGDSANLVNVPSDFYTLTVTDSNGCSATSSPHTISDAGGPSPPTVNSPSPYCDGDIIANLSASGTGGILYWFSDAALTDTLDTGATFISGATTTDTFYVAEMGACLGSAEQVIITVNPLPVIDASPDTATIIGGESVNLFVTGSITYSWT